MWSSLRKTIVNKWKGISDEELVDTEMTLLSKCGIDDLSRITMTDVWVDLGK